MSDHESVLVAGNLKKHIACLDKLKEKQCEGEASLQNALELTSQSLRSTSMFTHNLSVYILMTMSFLRSFCVLEYFSVILVLSAVFAVFSRPYFVRSRYCYTVASVVVVCLSSVTLCIVAKRCVLEQKLL